MELYVVIYDIYVQLLYVNVKLADKAKSDYLKKHY